MKKYFYLILLLIFVLFLKSGDLSLRSISAQNEPYCNYAYGEWGTCNDMRIKTRTFTATPTGCYEYQLPVTEEPCNQIDYPTSTIPCIYAYGDWSTCSASGIQTRTYGATPTNCYQAVNPPLLHQACTSTNTTTTIACSYAYSAWSACNASGTQTRTYTIAPTGCYPATYPELHQACTSTSATTTPCSYAYSAWSACNASGTQARAVLYEYPGGCYPIKAPVLYQTCYSNSSSTVPCTYTYGGWSACNASGTQARAYTITPTGCYKASLPEIYRTCTSTSATTTPCSYIYSAWSACNSSGTQIRAYTGTPAGCYQVIIPVMSQACSSTQAATTTPCSYAYSAWSACTSYNYQTRTVISKYPTGCYPAESPTLKNECVYVKPVSETTTINVINIPACKYDYSVWSDCVLNKQTRMVIDKLPLDCLESIAPVLYQPCKSTSTVIEITRPVDAPAPAPQAVLAPVVISQTDFNGKTSNEWQKYYFGSESCKRQEVCGGAADPDEDGLNNNEEYRFGTDPKNPDTDHDGYVDADEIQNGRNPLVASSQEKKDAMVFENAKEKGEVRQDLYKVNNVEMVKKEKANKSLKITGKALPDIYVTIYIYSDPVVLTIKTDSQGNWSYVLDNPLEEGEHQVYVAVTDNVGKIVAKSEPIVFVQTAEAAIVSTLPAIGVSDKNEVSPTKAWFKGSYSLFIALGILGLIIALASIGLIRTSVKKPEDLTNK